MTHEDAINILNNPKHPEHKGLKEHLKTSALIKFGKLFPDAIFKPLMVEGEVSDHYKADIFTITGEAIFGTEKTTLDIIFFESGQNAGAYGIEVPKPFSEKLMKLTLENPRILDGRNKAY